jgi:hypothetical protein
MEEEIWRHPQNGCSVKGLLDCGFFIPPYKFKIRVYLEGLLELHYGDPTTAARSLLMILVKLTKFIYDDPMGQ